MTKLTEKPMFPQWPASNESKEAGLCHPDGTALIGRVTYASGEQREFTDPEAYLQTIREELPYRDTTGFLVAAKSAGLRFRLTAKTSPAPLRLLFQTDPLRWAPFGVLLTLPNDPVVRKAVDDLLLDFAEEDNPRRACNYGLTEAGKRALREVADPERPHTYAWFVLTDCNTPEEQLQRDLTLEEDIRVYQKSVRPEKRLGLTKDGTATVDLVHSQDGEQRFFEDHQALASFREDPVVAGAVEELHRALEQRVPQQDMTIGGI